MAAGARNEAREDDHVDINETQLTKGQLRKLTALRKSLGRRIADAAFVKWLATQSDEPVNDSTARKIEQALNPIVGELKFPRGSHYVVRRGRGRVVVERVDT